MSDGVELRLSAEDVTDLRRCIIIAGAAHPQLDQPALEVWLATVGADGACLRACDESA